MNLRSIRLLCTLPPVDPGGYRFPALFAFIVVYRAP